MVDSKEHNLAMPLSLLLDSLVQSQRQRPGMATIFDGAYACPPTVSLQFYINRIIQYAGCNRAIMVASLIFLDRVMLYHPRFAVTECNVHRLLLACVVTAVKTYEDEFFSNSHYAKIGGITADEMNRLEIALLTMVNWQTFVTPEQFSQYDSALAAAEGYCLWSAAAAFSSRTDLLNIQPSIPIPTLDFSSFPALHAQCR